MKEKSFPHVIFRGSEACPTISGFVINPSELGLKESHLNPNKKSNWNNHHGCWVKKEFGKLAILQTCRDLELNQFGMLIDQHEELHKRYDEPKMPTIQQAMDRLVAGYECGERLRYGSQNNPQYKEFTEDKIIMLHDEYNRVAEHKIISYHQ